MNKGFSAKTSDETALRTLGQGLSINRKKKRTEIFKFFSELIGVGFKGYVKDDTHLLPEYIKFASHTFEFKVQEKIAEVEVIREQIIFSESQKAEIIMEVHFPEKLLSKKESILECIKLFFDNIAYSLRHSAKMSNAVGEVVFFNDISKVLANEPNLSNQFQSIIKRIKNTLNCDYILIDTQNQKKIEFGNKREYLWLKQRIHKQITQTVKDEKGVSFASFPTYCEHHSCFHYLLVARKYNPFKPAEKRFLESMSKRLVNLDKLEHLFSIRLNSEMVQRDLEIARTIQKQLLPKSNLVQGDYEISGECRSAGYVGGDTFDFFKIKENRIAAFILDVSGHSINTSFLMSTVRGYLKALLLNNFSLEDAVASVNRMICDDIEDAGLFVTGLVMMIDTTKNILEFINMGHYPFMLIDSNKKFLEDDMASMPLGVLKDEKYTSGKTNFFPGTSIFTYTDGLIESKSIGGTLFGHEHIVDVFKKSENECPDKILQNFFQEYKNHVGFKSQEDDITLMVVKRS